MIEGMFDKVVFHIFSICQLLKMDLVYSSLHYLLLGFGWFLEQCMGNDVRTHKFLVTQIKPPNDHKEFMKSYKTNNQMQNVSNIFEEPNFWIFIIMYSHVPIISTVPIKRTLSPNQCRPICLPSGWAVLMLKMNVVFL